MPAASPGCPSERRPLYREVSNPRPSKGLGRKTETIWGICRTISAVRGNLMLCRSRANKPGVGAGGRFLRGEGGGREGGGGGRWIGCNVHLCYGGCIAPKRSTIQSGRHASGPSAVQACTMPPCSRCVPAPRRFRARLI